MDHVLIEYLISGRAWVLVGSGPSIEMGYPTWRQLANDAASLVKSERPGLNTKALDSAILKADFPGVFEEARRILGAQRLLERLSSTLRPKRSPEIYKLIARWPVRIYLTTNYDDEIQTALANLGEAYLPYSNSESHMANLHPDLSGAIFKLHGDLRSEAGLILTTSSYEAISNSPDWQYWRTKLTSVFQFVPMIVVGHSLTDPNVKAVLEAAKLGAGVHQPICWIAPGVSFAEVQHYLEKYRIRVITYDNRDGDHANLRLLIEKINDFVPPRTAVRLEVSNKIEIEEDAAAPAFFVYNHLLGRNDYDQKRLDILTAALQAAIPKLPKGGFTISAALKLAGWPADVDVTQQLEATVGEAAVSQGFLIRDGVKYKLSDTSAELAAKNRADFDHVLQRFLASLCIRIAREYPGIPEDRRVAIAKDINSSLTTYFKDGGLTLASIVFSKQGPDGGSRLPFSILRFVNKSCERYGDTLERQAFFTTAISSFSHATSAEREYLGRIAQGFFGFHALGAFGDVAIERLRQTTSTVWLLDSNVQIAALALGSPVSTLWRECFKRLRELRVRIFTTDKLFDETREHWWFANKVVSIYGATSIEVVAAARGEVPFRRSNAFLEGFVRWRAAGNPSDWGTYNFEAFGNRQPGTTEIRSTLEALGVEVIAVPDWPGFADEDFLSRDTYTESIAKFRKRKARERYQTEPTDFSDPSKKAEPEAESLMIVRNERSGKYHILSRKGDRSPGWFISDTSILNAIEQGLRITWQPDAFLRFVSTLSVVKDPKASERAFEVLLLGLAESGVTLLDSETAASVLGGVIDQARVKITEMREMYEDVLAQKYGDPLDDIFSSIDPASLPLAALELANEIGQAQEVGRKRAEERAERAARRADSAEKALQQVEKFRRQMEAKLLRGKQKAKKRKAKARSRPK